MRRKRKQTLVVTKIEFHPTADYIAKQKIQRVLELVLRRPPVNKTGERKTEEGRI